MVIFENNVGNIFIEGSKIEFTTYGSGTKTLLAFHGFGLTKESFSILENKLGNKYTIYSFDLFFHGNSYWNHKDQPLSKTTLINFIDKFLNHFKIDRFSVMGYSLGGKISLCITEHYAASIDQLTMIAADGFVISPWYKMATGFNFTRNILKYIVFKPTFYFTVTGILSRIGIVPKSTIKFAELNMSTLSLRKKVYQTWVVYRLLKIDVPEFCNLANHHNISVHFFLGLKDTIIPLKAIVKASSSIKNRTVKIINCSHSRVLIEFEKLL